MTDEIFARGDVLDPEGKPLDVRAAFRPGSHVWVFRPLPDEPELPSDLPVLYEDEYILAVDKPHSLPVTPRGSFVRQTAVTKLRVETDNELLSPVHRLDRLTAGVLLFAKTREARGPLQALFELQRVSKTYELIAPLTPLTPDAGPPDLPVYPAEPRVMRSRIVKDASSLQAREVPGAPNALTGVVLLKEIEETGWGLYGANPLSGKTHQIRVHMNSLGRPIYGDPLYPRVHEDELRQPIGNLRLLAREVLLKNPFTQEYLRIRSDRTLDVSTIADSH
ncbi:MULTISPECIES: pseudouridine synthase [Micrococcaceae]|uniref:pseudouridine synthase n=1 Tax=unclassified Kocuria TaxID=2649579 RepID=UPI001EDD9E5F|nr:MULTISPECIES: pseudouridine synthase [unclassified Kocuria]